MVAENISVWRCLRHRRGDAADVLDEAHVEHAVGFVEHEELDVAELDVALAHQVEQAARRGDQDVDAASSASIWRPMPTPPNTMPRRRPRPRP